MYCITCLALFLLTIFCCFAFSFQHLSLRLFYQETIKISGLFLVYKDFEKLWTFTQKKEKSCNSLFPLLYSYHVHLCTRINISTQICFYVYIDLYEYTNLYIYAYMYLGIHVSLCIFVAKCVSIQLYTQICMHFNINIWLFCVCVCVGPLGPRQLLGAGGVYV